MKRKGLEAREGPPLSGKQSREKTTSFYSSFETALAGPPACSLQFCWLAEGIKQRDKELPPPSLGFKVIWGSFPSAVAWGHLAFVKGARNEVRLLGFDFNSTTTWCIFNRYLRIIVIATRAAHSDQTHDVSSIVLNPYTKYFIWSS